MRQNSNSAYRMAAASGATHVGMLILVYDAIAADLNKAGEAAARDDVAGRCRASNHALSLLGHLQTWTTYLEDPTLATTLEQFYGMLRFRILQLQKGNSAAELRALAQMVGETRAVWQKKEEIMVETLAKQRGSAPMEPREGRVEQPPARSTWSA